MDLVEESGRLLVSEWAAVLRRDQREDPGPRCERPSTSWNRSDWSAGRSTLPHWPSTPRPPATRRARRSPSGPAAVNVHSSTRQISRRRLVESQQDRFHLNRGGTINGVRYDRQTFDFAEAGCSCGSQRCRQVEDHGDAAPRRRRRQGVVSGVRRHDSLLWLMLDDTTAAGRRGYVWVEFTRSGTVAPRRSPAGSVCRPRSPRERRPRGSSSHPTVGEGLELEDESGPVTPPAAQGRGGSRRRGPRLRQCQALPRACGRLLFGLPVDQYDGSSAVLLVAQPQVGEDIDPKRLAEQLVNALTGGRHRHPQGGRHFRRARGVR